MNYKNLLFGVLAVLISLVVYDLIVKRLLKSSGIAKVDLRTIGKVENMPRPSLEQMMFMATGVTNDKSELGVAGGFGPGVVGREV